MKPHLNRYDSQALSVQSVDREAKWTKGNWKWPLRFWPPLTRGSPEQHKVKSTSAFKYYTWFALPFCRKRFTGAHVLLSAGKWMDSFVNISVMLETLLVNPRVNISTTIVISMLGLKLLLLPSSHSRIRSQSCARQRFNSVGKQRQLSTVSRKPLRNFAMLMPCLCDKELFFRAGRW
jgi:hypothetical protein